MAEAARAAAATAESRKVGSRISDIDGLREFL
jgi:hypothetical protein